MRFHPGAASTFWTPGKVGAAFALFAGAWLVHGWLRDQDHLPGALLALAIAAVCGLVAWRRGGGGEARGRGRRGPLAHGFTLIEVLMTVAITAMVFAMVGGILLSVLQAGQNIEETSRDEKAGYGVLSVLRRDLAGAFAYGLGGPAFRGEDQSDSGRDADRLSFVTTADVLVGEDGVRPRLVEVGYRLKSETVDDQTMLVLYRRAEALAGDPLSGDAEFVELYGRVESLNLRYLDPETKDWVEKWEEDALPPAVQVELKLLVDPERKRAADEEGVTLEPPTFTTVIGIPTRAEPAEDQGGDDQQPGQPAGQ